MKWLVEKLESGVGVRLLSDCNILCHIVYGWTESKGRWIHMTIVPFSSKFQDAIVKTFTIPVEFLTDEERNLVFEKEVPNSSTEPSGSTGTNDRKADWSTLILCHACGAGNPVNATECIRCKKKLLPLVGFPPSVPTSPEQSKTSHSQDDETDALRALGLLGSIKILDLTDHQLLNSEKHPFRRKLWRWLLMPLCIVCLVFLVILLSIVIVKNTGVIIGGIISITIIGLLFKGVNYLIETQDLREARRDERNEERAKRERRKKQIQMNNDIEEIASAVKEQISSQEPIENVLPKINTKGYEYEAIAKAISSADSLKEAEKGRLFNNMEPDFISHILNYFNDSEKITILRYMNPGKREDVLMRFSLSKRSQLSEALNKKQ